LRRHCDFSGALPATGPISDRYHIDKVSMGEACVGGKVMSITRKALVSRSGTLPASELNCESLEWSCRSESEGAHKSTPVGEESLGALAQLLPLGGTQAQEFKSEVTCRLMSHNRQSAERSCG